MTTVLYVGTDEGVTTVRSDTGASWEAKAAKMPPVAVEEVVVLASRPNVVLAGTRGDGVWRSDDSGETWYKPSRGRRGPGKVRCLTVDPHDENRIYAGCEPIEVFVSEDLGEHWTRLDSVREHPYVPTITYPVPTVEPHVRDIAVDPADPDTIYLALQVGYILKTTDRGRTWKLLDQGLDADVHTLALDPRDPSHVQIATGGHDSRLGKTNGRALFSSRDGGETWGPLALEFYQEYSIPFVLKPGEPEVAFSALANDNPSRWRARESGAEGVLIRTKDGGATWEAIDLGGMPEAGRNMVVTLSPDPSDPDRLFGAFDNGELISSQDGGTSWSKIGVRLAGANDVKVASS